MWLLWNVHELRLKLAFFFPSAEKKTSRTELLKCFWSYLTKSWRKSFLFDKFVGRSVETQILVEIILNTYQKVGFLNFQFSKQINELVLVRVGRYTYYADIIHISMFLPKTLDCDFDKSDERFFRVQKLKIIDQNWFLKFIWRDTMLGVEASWCHCNHSVVVKWTVNWWSRFAYFLWHRNLTKFRIFCYILCEQF